MPSLKEVKTRINSVISTQQITKAMKMVAAAKLRRAQDRIIQMRPYAQKMKSVLQNVSSGSTDQENGFSEQRAEGRILVIVISSDRGLCGAFNSMAFRTAAGLINKKYLAQKERGDLMVMPIGKKSLDFFRKRDYEVVEEFSATMADLTFDNARKIADFAMKGFSSQEFDKVEIVYNEFKNVATQILRTEQFLPILPPDEDEISSSIDYIFEPSREFITQELIPRSLKVQVYKALLESNAAEQGARMTAMDKATENAGELLDELKLTYNRTRQAAITKEILEIVGGAEALQ